MKLTQQYLVKSLLKEKDNLDKLSSFLDLKNLSLSTIKQLILLESLLVQESENEYSEYQTGGHYKDGLSLLTAIQNLLINNKDQDYIFENFKNELVCVDLYNVKEINSIQAVLKYDEYKINKLLKNTETPFLGFKYQAKVVGINIDAKNWIALKTLNCSAEQFKTAMSDYCNSFDIEPKHRCFLGFYFCEIEKENLLLIQLDYIDKEYLFNKVLSIPQDCIFQKKLKLNCSN